MPSWFPSASQHFMLSAVAVLIYITSTRARRERRAPSAAIAWVMGLALIPYLLLPLYLLFGHRKLHAAPIAKITRRDLRAHWAAALIESFGLPPPEPTIVRFHFNGRQARDALWETIEKARTRLDVCTFLIGDDPLGKDVLSRLTSTARAGVRVRLLLDGVGALLVSHPAFDSLRAAGGEVALFRPLFRLRRIGPRNLRNHRKAVLADGTTLWSGGRNLAAEYFVGDGHAEPWVDFSFDLHGAVATAAARQFEVDWAAARGEPVQEVRIAPLTVEGALAQFLPSGPDQAEDTAQTLLVAACHRAQQRILAVTPYFVPDEALQTAIRVAALRGVRITLALPAVSNHRLADFVRSRALRELAGAGAQIRMLPGMVHAKALVIDDSFALCGSINLDVRSLLINYESAVVFYGAHEIASVADWIEHVAADGAVYAPEAPTLARDLAEGLLLSLAFEL
jgi:cardiolipin synthase